LTSAKDTQPEDALMIKDMISQAKEVDPKLVDAKLKAVDSKINSQPAKK